MALQGVVSPLCDPSTGVFPGPDWLDAIESLRQGQPLAIRGSIGADPENHVHLDWLRNGMRAYRARGHPVYLVLEASLSRFHELPANAGNPALLPNAALGFEGNPLLNDFINRYSLTACSVLEQLRATGDLPAGVWLANEPNVLSSGVQPGDSIPVTKPEALAPAVYGALLQTTAMRLRALVPQLTTIWPACFSVLVKFATGVAGESPWFEHYWRLALAYLAAHGQHPPYPWIGLGANLEGAVAAPNQFGPGTYADYVFYSLARIKGEFGITGPSVVGEWGVPSQGLNTDVMAASFRALDHYASHMFFFCAGMWENYGTWPVTIAGNRFIPGPPTALVPFLRAMYTGTV